MRECLSKNLFGLPKSFLSVMKAALDPSVSPRPAVFLADLSSFTIHGVFCPAASPQVNYSPGAFAQGPVGRHEAQLAVVHAIPAPPARMSDPSIIVPGPLDAAKVHILFQLLGVPLADGSVPAPVPAPTAAAWSTSGAKREGQAQPRLLSEQPQASTNGGDTWGVTAASGQWMSYEADVSATLSAAKAAGQDSTTFVSNGATYAVLFDSMQEVNVLTSQRRPVKVLPGKKPAPVSAGNGAMKADRGSSKAGAGAGAGSGAAATGTAATATATAPVTAAAVVAASAGAGAGVGSSSSAGAIGGAGSADARKGPPRASSAPTAAAAAASGPPAAKALGPVPRLPNKSPVPDGFVFVCTDKTRDSIMSRNCFALPARFLKNMKASITPRTVLFLSNKSRSTIEGCFQANGAPMFDAVPGASASASASPLPHVSAARSPVVRLLG